MTTIKYSVCGGPSKWDLSLGLFDRNPSRTVRFDANCPVGTQLAILVTSVQVELGSSESWNIEGIIHDASRENRRSNDGLYLPKIGLRVFINYRTDRRQGSIRFFTQSTNVSIAELEENVRQAREACLR